MIISQQDRRSPAVAWVIAVFVRRLASNFVRAARAIDLKVIVLGEGVWRSEQS